MRGGRIATTCQAATHASGVARVAFLPKPDPAVVYTGRMRCRRWWSAPCAFAILSCSGPAKPAESPVQYSRVVLNGGSPDASATFAGPAFVRFDPSTRVLGIFIFDSSTVPTPTCDLVTTRAISSLQAGGSAMLFSTTYDPKAALHHVKADIVGFSIGDDATFRISGGATDGVLLKITGAAGNVFSATVSSDASARMRAEGTINARTCPVGDLGPLVLRPFAR